MATALAASSTGSAVEKLTGGSVSDEVFIMVAGKPGNGKSTALNNIFGVDLKTSISACSATKAITTRRVVKNGVSLTVVDTPGLGAVDIDKKAVTDAMAETTSGLSYTLLYCLSIAPSCRLTEMDKIIIQNLHTTLGEEAWKNCVILLTFSDTARRDGFGSDSQKDLYVKYIKGVAQGFQSILRTCGSGIAKVSVVFDYESNTIFHRADSEAEVMAIPVGKNVDRRNEPDILPGVIARSELWTDLVFMEIMRKTKEERRRAFVALKYGVEVADSAASGVMIGLGTEIQVPTDAAASYSETTKDDGVLVVTEYGTTVCFPIQAVLSAIRRSQVHSDASLT